MGALSLALPHGRAALATLLAAGILLATLVKFRDMLLARRRFPALAREVPADVPPPAADAVRAGMRPMDVAPVWPRVSLIVPACNEAHTLEPAVVSMARQDYPNLEVILINDRSTDGTGTVMEDLAARFPGVRVHHITVLPPGWLGKNHALYSGSLEATGDWLLFADADVVMDPTAVRRAVAYAEQEGLDHLTLSGDMLATGYWLRGWISFVLMSFLTYESIHKVNDPRSKVGAGFGMFNLIRRTAYERIGTHQAISLRPDDDMRLGQRVKLLGLRQRAANGKGLLRVEWYPTLPEALRGHDKNAFAFFNYSLPLAAGSILAVLLVMVWPFLGVLMTAGLARWLYAVAALVQLGMFTLAAYMATGSGISLVPTYPLHALTFALILTRAVALNLWEGGIRWRGTFYPLALLRSQSGLPGDD